MADEENMLKKRFIELSERAFSKNIYTFTEFLSPAEQALLKSCIKGAPYHFDGGYENAERRLRFSEAKNFADILNPHRFHISKSNRAQ